MKMLSKEGIERVESQPTINAMRLQFAKEMGVSGDRVSVIESLNGVPVGLIPVRSNKPTITLKISGAGYIDYRVTFTHDKSVTR